MLGNGIQQTTATTGTGSLTLAASGTKPTFNLVFGLNRVFGYALLNAAGDTIESGYGYLSDATTLVRAFVHMTWNGTLYATGTPTAMSLSGTTTVICTPDAASLESMMATVDSQSASVGRWLSCAGRNVQTSPSAVSSLRVYYTSFLLRTAAQINALMLCVTTPGAGGSVARCGFHASNEKGYIGPLLASTADLDTASNGNKSGAVTLPQLPSGRYVVSCVFSGAPTVTGYSSGHANVIGGSPFGFTNTSPPVGIDFRYEAVASAVIPSTPSLSTTAMAIGIAHGPMVFVGVA